MIRTALTTRGPQLSPTAWHAALSRLPHAEQLRLRRYRRWQDAQSSLIGRLLMANLAADLLGIGDPYELDFARDVSGRPYLEGPAVTHIDVNVAHAGGYVAAAISNVGRIGVDVEVERAVHAGLVDRVCAPAELALLRQSPPADRRSRFFQLWTLKEAYIKAVGAGLALDLTTITFPLRSDHIHFAVHDVPDEASRWHFRSWHPAPDVWLAVCAEHCTPPAICEEMPR